VLRRPAGSAVSAGRRYQVNWTAELRAGADRVPCVVLDVSSGGACLRIKHVPPGPGPLLLVAPTILPIPVAVAWRKRNRIGLRFLEEQQWVPETCRPPADSAVWLQESTRAGANGSTTAEISQGPGTESRTQHR
jgi:hypothetical protein